MLVSDQAYFNMCYEVFQQEEMLDKSACQLFLKIGERSTACLRFAGAHLLKPFGEALEHLATSAVATPDLTVCVWDNSRPRRSLEVSSRGRDWKHFKARAMAPVQVVIEEWPRRESLFDRARNLGLYFMDDVSEYPWYEKCRPLRNLFHWWAIEQGLYLTHAASIGTADGGVLLAGKKGVGKSTTALSSLDSSLSYAADDLCFVGFENEQVFAYSLYNTGKLENFERLPHLAEHTWNRDRLSTEKAIIFVHQQFPEKMIKRLPVKAILLPEVKDARHSTIAKMPVDEAARIVVTSTATELQAAGPRDFMGLYKSCKLVPCYRLESGTDLAQLNQLIVEVIGQG